ncbi:ATP-binding protein [Halalkalibacter akibai]|uniref:Histidine kinase/HSP90-like ATPase domain-containing protein n=1 Tax=Halalkalibacter akibai (strain ATCC 43226 / DSM 21942 / CIP 109018 / JCM 9157 / 1139) TaxID=1236973 RepID=W4QV99_HALA3|nr:ATP-binding protein [Halalkalibacter akibai]GAE35832.1 hypothetical protein JCM9157_2969 [Halalkalibacter akibai JCM 9157]
MSLALKITTFEEFEQHLPKIEQFLLLHTNDMNLILFSLLEAINNAFEHGMNQSNGIVIKVNIFLDKKHLVVTISHNGVGFDYEEKLLAVTDPDQYFLNHLTSLRGRGIAIMKRCADKLTYSDKGRKVTLFFNLGEMS